MKDCFTKTSLFLLLILCFSCSGENNYIYENTSLKDLESLKFCYIGDTGMANSIQEKVALALKDEACHQVFFAGDIIYSRGIKNSEDPQLEEKFFRYYRPVYESHHKPQLSLVMGNHDFQGSPLAWVDVSKKNPKVFFPNYYYAENAQGICTVALDTDLFVYGSYFLEALEQIRWLDQLKTYLASHCQYKIALTHHPYKSTGHHGDTKGMMKVFYEKMVLGKFDMIISGHDHFLSDEGIHSQTRQLISGAGGRPPKGTPAGFLILEFEKKEGRMTLKEYRFKMIPNSL